MDETCEVNTAPMATGRDDPRTGRAAGPHASTSTTPGSAQTIGTHTSPPAATQTVSTLRNDVSDQEFKTIVVPCKRCAQEFELRLPMHYYETMVAISEDGETVEFTGTCPDCRADDPFLRMLDEAGIPTIGRDFARRKK
jgi:hypothetical protein